MNGVGIGLQSIHLQSKQIRSVQVMDESASTEAVLGMVRRKMLVLHLVKAMFRAFVATILEFASVGFIDTDRLVLIRI